jgi:DNA-binding XRE family transcriptional regulator
VESVGTVVVYSTPQDLAQAGQFARDCLHAAELRTFDTFAQNLSFQSVLVYLTHPDNEHISSLLKTLRPSVVNVVIYCAELPTPEEAALLGRLVGEVRPYHTELVFRAEAAVSALQVSGRQGGKSPDKNCSYAIRERLGLTQTEMGQALGVSLRTIQNWERQAHARRGHLLRDLEELSAILSGVMSPAEIPIWLRSENNSFGSKRPIELVLDGRSRDVISEFRCLQAGDPV